MWGSGHPARRRVPKGRGGQMGSHCCVVAAATCLLLEGESGEAQLQATWPGSSWESSLGVTRSLTLARDSPEGGTGLSLLCCHPQPPPPPRPPPPSQVTLRLLFPGVRAHGQGGEGSRGLSRRDVTASPTACTQLARSRWARSDHPSNARRRLGRVPTRVELRAL